LESEDTTEVLFRRFELRVADFIELEPTFDPEQLAVIGFVFDRSKKGAIIIDDLSITTGE